MDPGVRQDDDRKSAVIPVKTGIQILRCGI